MNITDRLNELMLSYRREARRCLRGKAYLGATVMQVAAFEAGLQVMCFLYRKKSRKQPCMQGSGSAASATKYWNLP